MIFVADGPRLLAASCTLDNAEPGGDFLNFGHGHYEIWQGWRQSRELDAAARAVLRAHEYEELATRPNRLQPGPRSLHFLL